MDPRITKVRLAKWSVTIRSAYESGLSIRQWCAENHVNRRNFYRWEKRLRETAYEELQAQANALNTTLDTIISENKEVLSGPSKMSDDIVFAELRPPTEDFSSQTMPVRTDPIRIIPEVVIQRGAYQIIVGSNFSETTLERILRVIDHVE